MKYDLKPEDQRKVKLFAHRGEAIVFWMSLGALIFLVIISLFRYFYLDKIAQEYNNLARDTHPVLIELQKLKAQNDSLQNLQYDLIHTVQTVQDSMEKMRKSRQPAPEPPTRKKTKKEVIVLPDY